MVEWNAPCLLLGRGESSLRAGFAQPSEQRRGLRLLYLYFGATDTEFGAGDGDDDNTHEKLHHGVECKEGCTQAQVALRERFCFQRLHKRIQTCGRCSARLHVREKKRADWEDSQEITGRHTCSTILLPTKTRSGALWRNHPWQQSRRGLHSPGGAMPHQLAARFLRLPLATGASGTR